MKLLQVFKLVIIGSMLGLAACSTVDLSQVAIKKPMAQPDKPKQSVVERASSKMNALFAQKKWSAPRIKDKSRATAILLHGMSKIKNNHSYRAATKDILRSDILTASSYIRQTTKAAEIYLAMVVTEAELDNELGNLETALINAKQAKIRFGDEAGRHNIDRASAGLTDYDIALAKLQNITDEFGNRSRQFVANKAQINRS